MKFTELTEIRLAGFGGQGVILLAIILGRAASIYQGAFATMTQNFGPEARGGTCSAQLVLSESPVLYPYVTRPDCLVVMSQVAYSCFVPKLKEGGTLIVEQDLVRVSDLNHEIQVYSVPATRIAEELGKRMVLNSAMVGFFTAVTHLLDTDCRAQSSRGFGPAKLPRTEPAGLRKRIGAGNHCINREPCRCRTADAVLAGVTSSQLHSSALDVVRFNTARRTDKPPARTEKQTNPHAFLPRATVVLRIYLIYLLLLATPSSARYPGAESSRGATRRGSPRSLALCQ